MSSTTATVEVAPATLAATGGPSEERHAFTTGRVEMWNGTTDGREAFLDPSDGSTNLNPKKVHSVKVHDIRYQEPQPKLPDNGYQIGQHPTFVTEEQFMRYTSPEGKQFIRDAYWPEVRRLVESQLPGSKDVIPWHFSVRNQTAGYHPDEIFFMKTGVSQPAATVHVDNDHKTAIDHMRRELGDARTDELIAKHKRWAIINTWRPIGVPVQMWPLLVVDHSLVKNWNYDEHIGRVYRSNDPKYYKKHDNFLKWNDDYVFRYASALAPDEVIMFRDYDSREDTYRGCPHGGFQDDASPADAIPRRSIEVRCFAFFDDDE